MQTGFQVKWCERWNYCSCSKNVESVLIRLVDEEGNSLRGNVLLPIYPKNLN